MNKKGYTLKELIIVLSIVTLVAIVSIVKISFAFSEIDNTESIKNEEKVNIKKAAAIYAKEIEDDLKEEKEMYVSGTELIDKGILADVPEYKSLKIKLVYNEDTDKIKTEIMNK